MNVAVGRNEKAAERFLRRLPGSFHDLYAVRRIEDPERQVVALPEKMSVFRHQCVGARPLNVGCDERIGRLETFRFVLRAQFKGDDEIFVYDGEAHDELDEFSEFLGGQVASDFLGDETGDADGMRRRFGYCVKERFTGGFSGDSEAEDEFVGVKYEQQIFCPKVLPWSCEASLRPFPLSPQTEAAFAWIQALAVS